jgi:hypothetical protein
MILAVSFFRSEGTMEGSSRMSSGCLRLYQTKAFKEGDNILTQKARPVQQWIPGTRNVHHLTLDAAFPEKLHP